MIDINNKYFLIKDFKLIICNSLFEISTYFDIEILDDGRVKCNNKIDTISYKRSEFTNTEILEDFIKTRLTKLNTDIEIFKIISGYKL